MRCTCALVWQVDVLMRQTHRTRLAHSFSLHCCSTFPRRIQREPLTHPLSTEHFYLSNYFFNNSPAIFNIDDGGGGGGRVLCVRASDTSAESALSVLCVCIFCVCVRARCFLCNVESIVMFSMRRM